MLKTPTKKPLNRNKPNKKSKQKKPQLDQVIPVPPPQSSSSSSSESPCIDYEDKNEDEKGDYILQGNTTKGQLSGEDTESEEENLFPISNLDQHSPKPEKSESLETQKVSHDPKHENCKPYIVQQQPSATGILHT